MSYNINDYVYFEPILPHERIQRVFKKGYKRIVEENREDAVDFSVIPELKFIVRMGIIQCDNPYAVAALAEAYVHLGDAANEQLLKYAREEHFDIAGYKVWYAHYTLNCHWNQAPEYFGLFKRANGI